MKSWYRTTRCSEVAFRRGLSLAMCGGLSLAMPLWGQEGPEPSPSVHAFGIYGTSSAGGRMLNRLGLRNPTHLHSWETVDAPLPHALFLGEDGLVTEGADLSIYFDTRQPTVLTLGFGNRPSHDHDPGEDEHRNEDDHEGFGGPEVR